MENKDEKIYVSIVAYGQWDENVVRTIYVGESHKKAKKAISDFTFPDPNNNFAWIEHWLNEKNIKDEEIIMSNSIGSQNIKS